MISVFSIVLWSGILVVHPSSWSENTSGSVPYDSTYYPHSILAKKNPTKFLFLSPLQKALKNSTRKNFLSSLSSESENPNLPHNGTSFFQVGTVPGQRSYSEKVVVTNCQKDFFVLRSVLSQLLKPGANWSALFSMKHTATWSMVWTDKVHNEGGMKGKTSDDEKHIWNPWVMHYTKCSVC